MIRTLRLLCVLVFPALGLLPLSAQTQTTPPAAPVSELLVQVQIEFIELPHANLTELLAARTPVKSRELRERVQELVKAGTAKILDSQIATGRSGEKLSSQAAQEFIYPTEYQQPEMEDAPRNGGLGGGLEPEGPRPEPNTVPFIPTSWETRKIGSSLEAEPTLSADGKLIGIQMDPELTWHTGNTIWQDVKDRLGNLLKIQMPEIYTLKFHSVLNLRPGSMLFTTALSPKDASGNADLSRKVMVFVGADLVAAE